MLMKVTNRAQKSPRRRRTLGASSVEYIVVLVLVALAGITAFKTFGGAVKEKMGKANTDFAQVQ
jgi:Flp pilus assembly pilin Flp